MASVQFPRDEGLKKEAQYYEHLQRSYQSKSLQYAFFAQRLATKVVTLYSLNINT